MENKSFDDIIKNKVNQFSEEFDTQAWELFQAQELNAQFDADIKDQLQDFEVQELPSDFEILSDKMPSGFDALIGSKLAQASIDDGPDWDQFEKILDNQKSFDDQVTDTMAGYQAPVSESEWPKLAAHLEKVERRRRRIVITKFIEAAVFLLFVITIMQLYPIQNIAKKQVYRTIGVTQEMNSASSKAASDIEQIASTPSNSNVQVTSNDIRTSLEVENIEARLVSVVKPQTEREVRYRTRSNTKFLPAIDLKAIDDKKVVILNERSTYRNVAGLDIERDLKFETADLNLLASLDIKDLSYDDRVFDYPVKDLASLKKEQYWFNVYGSPELNVIHTPYDKSYSPERYIVNEDEAIPAYSHISKGYTVGASISKETQNIEVEGGVEYTSLNYLPAQIEEVTGKATTGLKTTLLKEIIFDIVEIPVNLKYNIFRKKGWKIYGTNGVSAGMVAFANYDIEETTSKPLASLELVRTTVANERSFVDRKEFNDGVLQGGPIKKNVFATISSGFGVSKEITDKISFYVQPTYNHNLTQRGLGPNNDVHHRLSLQIGTKVRI